MKPEDKHQQFRELVIRQILDTRSPDRPSKMALKKMSDGSLAKSLFDNAILAETNLWREDIIKAIAQLDPQAKVSKNNTSFTLINKLIKVSQEVTKQKMLSK